MIEKPVFQFNLLHIRYWHIWLFDILLRVSSFFPITWQMFVGKKLSFLYPILIPKRVNIARRNLAFCFPQHTETEIEQLLYSNLQESGKAIFDFANACYRPHQKLQDNIKIHGAEHIQKAKQDGTGIILLGVHSLLIEMVGRAIYQLQMLVPGYYCSIYRPNNNALIDYLQIKCRLPVSHDPDKGVRELIKQSDTRGVIKALKAGATVSYFADQSPSKKWALFVPMFAKDHVAVTKSIGKLAKLGNAKICPFFIERNSDNQYIFEISPPLENFPSDSVEADTRQLAGIMENIILRRADQYLWFHRRFKLQHDPSINIYA